MTVQIGDLVARFRADTTDVERGAQVARQQLQGVEQQAGQTARALEIMASQFAKMHGGTAQQALEMFQRTGAGPTQAALAQAAQEMQKTAAAAQQAETPTRNLARAASEHAVSARGAATAHEEITNSARLSETSIVRFGAALVGVNIGLSIAAGAGRLLHQNLQASLEAAVELDRVSRGLGAAYGPNAGQASGFAQRLAPQANTTATNVSQALIAAAPLTQYGLSATQTQQISARSADLAARYGRSFDEVFADVLKSVVSGGSQLDQYGLKLDDVRVKTEAYGGALASTFDRMTTAQQIAVRFNLLMEQTRDAQGSAATAASTLSGAYDRLGTSLDRLRERTGAIAGGGLQGPAQALGSFLSGLTSTSSSDRRAIVSDPNAPSGARIISTPSQFDVSGLPPSPGLPTNTPPSFIGPTPLRGIDLVSAQASNAVTLAARGQAEAQAQLTAIQLQSEQRRLSVAEDLANFKRQELETDAALAPLLLRQAELQDRITIASRDNLQSRRDLIAAQQAALPSTAALSGLDYAQQRLELRAEISRASVRAGGTPTEDIAALRAEYRNIELARPELALRQLDTQRGVEVTQQQRTGEDLQRQARQTNLEDERRTIEDQTIPLQEQLRLEQTREAVVERTVELADLANTRVLVTAQQALNEANTVRALADDTARLADEYSAGLRLGATAIERASAALKLSRDAMRDLVPLFQSLLPDNQARIANGLGAGGLGPTAGSIVFSPVFRLEGATRDDLRRQLNEAFDNFFAGASVAGSPAPASLAGAGR